MNLTTASVRTWAEEILRQLGNPARHSLDVATERSSERSAPPHSGSVYESRLRIGREGELRDGPGASCTSTVVLTLAFDQDFSVGVVIEASTAEAEAVALLAEQLQDAVLEATGGTPVPPCPGHAHPAVPDVVEGTACWTCPRSGQVRRPILTTG
jgi:hypothetical protein